MTPPASSSQKAIWSLVLGILGLACLCGLTGVPGVILGHLALRDIRCSGGRLEGMGMAVTGLVMGYLNTVLLLAMAAFVAMVAIQAGTPWEEPEPERQRRVCTEGQIRMNEALEAWMAAVNPLEGEAVDQAAVLSHLSGGERPVCPTHALEIQPPATVGERVTCPDPEVRDEHIVAW